jgi:hypothetical protein
MVPSFNVAPTKAVFSSIVHCPIVPVLVTTASELYDTSSFLFLGIVLEVSKKEPYTPPILPGGNNSDLAIYTVNECLHATLVVLYSTNQ